MYSRFVGFCAASLWVLACGAASARAAEEGAGLTAAASPYYGAERYSYYPPRRYTWRPWYSDSWRGAPSWRYAPRGYYEPRYGSGPRSYYYDYYGARRWQGHERPYWRGYDWRPYYSRPGEDRWTGPRRPVLPRWAGTGPE